jgi:hypothetical protein
VGGKQQSRLKREKLIRNPLKHNNKMTGKNGQWLTLLEAACEGLHIATTIHTPSSLKKAMIRKAANRL